MNIVMNVCVFKSILFTLNKKTVTFDFQTVTYVFSSLNPISIKKLFNRKKERIQKTKERKKKKHFLLFIIRFVNSVP
jgi:hypothetical protein